MAARVLLPGIGGQYTSENLATLHTVGTDTIDCSRCGGLAFQVNMSGSTGTFDIEQSFNGSDFVKVGNSVAVTDGTTVVLDPTDGPFGIFRLNGTSVSSGSTVVSITGAPALSRGW